MIRLVNQFDDERTRPTVATPSCGCCCCCCCCLASSISTTSISALQLGDIAVKRGASAVGPTVLVILNFCVAWIVATLVTEHAPATSFGLGIFIASWIGSYTIGMALTAAAAGAGVPKALGLGAGWGVGTAALFFLEFWIAAGFLIAGLFTYGIAIVLYFPAAALACFISIRWYVRRLRRLSPK